MTTLGDAADRARGVVEALDQVASHFEGCGDHMDTVVSQLNAVGLDGRAGDAAAVRERVDQVLKQTATVRRSVDGLLARILALADGGPGAGISSAAAGRPGPPLLRPGLDPGLEKGAL
ncbi:MAG: hypothetical protein ACRDUA_11110, partial [Micromonosporaceae bacterium]